MLRPLYNWTLEKAAHPHASWWLALISFIDGGLFPFPPHPLFGLMCLAQPAKAVRYAVIVTLASVMGGVLGYLIGHFLYDAVGTQLISALGLGASFPKAACYLQLDGAKIIVLKAFTPIPFILISITAGFISFPLPTFIAASLLSRGMVFVVIGGLFRVFGPTIKAYLDKYLGIIAAACLVVLISGYVAVSMLGGGAKAAHDKCSGATALPTISASR